MLLASGLAPMMAEAMPDTDEQYSEFLSMYIYGSDQISTSQDGMRAMVASSYWGFVGVYSTADRSQLFQLGPEADGTISYMWAAMSADGGTVVVADKFGLIRYFKVDNGTTPVWSYNTSLALSSLCVSGDGGKVLAGGMGGAAYFGPAGHQGTISDPGIKYECAMSKDAQRILLGHGSIISVYNSSMALKKNDLLPSAVSDLAVSTNGAVCAAGMADGRVRFYQFYNSISSNGVNWTRSFGSGNAGLALSTDGRVASVTTADSYALYDIAGTALLWQTVTDRAIESMVVSGDGEYAVVCHYHGNEAVILDRAGQEVRRWQVTEARNAAVDASGDTIALLGVGLEIYRPGLEIATDSDSWMVSAGIKSGFGLQVTRDGVPVSGASLAISLSDDVATVSVADQGNGRYWVTVLGMDVNDTEMVTWSATAVSGTYLNGTAVGTLTVLPVDDPANYDSRLQALSDQLAQAQADLDRTGKDMNDLQMLQLVTLVVAIILAMVIVFLMVRHSRPPAPKQ